jgi:hypothetical protein
LVDSLDEGGSGDLSFPTYRVEVSVDGKTDTIGRVRTHRMPVVGADGRVYFFGYEGGGFLNGGYIYEPRSRALTTFPTPPGAGALESHMSISSDARYIAYISTECKSSGGCGVVRTWPESRLIAETPAGIWCEGDEDYNDVRWLDPTHAEILYCAEGARDFWIHAIIAVTSRELGVDTLSSKPKWKQ